VIRKPTALLATAIIALAACGGDDDSASDTTTATTTAASITADSASAATTAAIAPTTAASTAPATSGAEFTGDVDSPFCVAGRQVDELQQTPPNPLDSDSYRAAVEGTLELMPELVANAPAELADDLPLAQAYFESVHAAFADAGFDVLAVEFGTIPDDPATRAARDRIEDYMEQVCGVPADDDDDDDELPTEGTMRDYLIAQFTEAGNTVEQADCMIEFMRTNSTDGDSQALGFALIRECGLTSQWVASGFTQEQADCMVAELRKLPEDVSDAEMEAALVGGCGLDD